MQFRTVMIPCRRRYSILTRIAFRRYLDNFEFDLTDDPATESVSVGFASDFASLPRELKQDVETGARTGAGYATEHGVRLCCVRFTLVSSIYHNTLTTTDAIQARVADAVACNVAEYHTQSVPPLHPAWLTSDVVALARGIRGAGHSGGVPILTDALLEAGCDDPLVIEHLRTCTDHGPCCWVAEMVCAQAEGR